VNLSPSELSELAELAVAAATEAGRMIARSRPHEVDHKPGAESLASKVVTEIDRRSESIILDVLRPTLGRFELGLLTEEQPDDGGRHRADHFWCIDPLDGTLPFIEGSSGYAVSIALVGRDGTPHIGVVCDPVGSSVLHAVRGLGAFRDGHPWSGYQSTGRPRGEGDALTLFADRSLARSDAYPALMETLQRIAVDMGLNGVQVNVGAGAVMNACNVLANSPACYLKYPAARGGGSLWDFAATACLFHEVSAVATDINGHPLDLNREGSTFMNHRGVLYATDDGLAQLIGSSRPDG
jgi:3'-phosphoadenosine 5'-phosphosulfate (PAPS) 3'-phosphatase